MCPSQLTETAFRWKWNACEIAIPKYVSSLFHEIIYFGLGANDFRGVDEMSRINAFLIFAALSIEHLYCLDPTRSSWGLLLQFYCFRFLADERNE